METKEIILEPGKSTMIGNGIVLLILVYIGRVQELFPFLENARIGKIVMGFSVLLFFLTPGKVNWQELMAMRQFRFVMYIVGLSLLSIITSVWVGGSVDFMKNNFTKTLLFFLLLVSLIDRQKEIQKIAWGIVVACFLLSIKTLMLEKVGRLTIGSTYDPNDLAFIMVSFLPIVFYMMKSEAGAKKLFLLTTAIAMLTTVLYTGSRGGFLGFAVVAVMIMVRERVSMKKALMYLVITASFVLAAAPSSFLERLTVKDYNYEKGGGGRLDIWGRGFSLMLKHPVLGVGVGGFEIAEGLSRGGQGKWSSAHNSFVQIGTELGIVGLVIFVRLVASSIVGMKNLRFSDEADVLPPWMLKGVEISLYGYIAAGFFLSQAYSPVLYLLVGMVIIAGKLVASQRSSSAEYREKSRAGLSF